MRRALLLTFALAAACGRADSVVAPAAHSLTGTWSGQTASGVAVSFTLVCLTAHDCAGQGAWGEEAASAVATFAAESVSVTLATSRRAHRIEGELLGEAEWNAIMARVDGLELMLRR